MVTGVKIIFLINVSICQEFVVEKIDRCWSISSWSSSWSTLFLLSYNQATKSHQSVDSKLENYSLELSFFVRMRNLHKHSVVVSRLLHLIIVLIFQRLIMITRRVFLRRLTLCDETIIFHRMNSEGRMCVCKLSCYSERRRRERKKTINLLSGNNSVRSFFFFFPFSFMFMMGNYRYFYETTSSLIVFAY